MIPLDPPFTPIRAFYAVFSCWLISQMIKVFRGTVKEKKFNFRWLFDTGGMPSSHSASVASLATSAGLYYGFNTLIFLIVFVFSMITMFDAAGVRRSVGKQAVILNKMLDEVQHQGGFQEKRLKELLGHTPVEVFAGAFLGILLTLLICGNSR